MITEAVLRWFFVMIGKLTTPIFDTIYTALGIDPSARFFIPSPLWFIVAQMGTFVTLMFPVALAYWAWRQVKA